jgi:hypothetical protein
MTRIESRLSKVERAIRKSHPSEEDELMFFVRLDPWHPEKPSESEIKWREEHPDFKGKIYVYTIGTKNLGAAKNSV